MLSIWVQLRLRPESDNCAAAAAAAASVSAHWYSALIIHSIITASGSHFSSQSVRLAARLISAPAGPLAGKRPEAPCSNWGGGGGEEEESVGRTAGTADPPETLCCVCCYSEEADTISALLWTPRDAVSARFPLPFTEIKAVYFCLTLMKSW